MGSGSGLGRETHVGHSPNTARRGPWGGGGHRPGHDVRPQVRPISAGPTAGLGRAVVGLGVLTPAVSLGQGLMVLG